MSKSGIPGISQIGSGVSSVGSAIGGFLGGAKTPDIAAPPTTPNPSTDGSTSDAMSKAEQDQDKLRGEAANFLTSGGGAGISGTPTTSRAVLLGN